VAEVVWRPGRRTRCLAGARDRRAQPAAHASDSARVFVTTLEDGEIVVGYYALTAAQIAPEDATARALKGQPQARPVPAVLLARLAVDREHQGAGLGRSLHQDVLLRCVEAADAIGARILLVRAKHDAAKAWYMQYGFEDSPTDPLHLLMLMKDSERFSSDTGFSSVSDGPKRTPARVRGGADPAA
jgi:GNAT superfamily N-acetyltransferase